MAKAPLKASCPQGHPYSGTNARCYNNKLACGKCMADRSLARRKRARALLWKLKDKPCMDCGVKYPPYVMDFDHLKDKEFTISQGKSKPLKLLIEEAEKCDIVCKNCHAIRTASRGGWDLDV